jgi:glycosyltransferase involved in cell wall biosynthesis
MPTISVLYMIRNESETISQSLSSVSQLADEIVVIDTGSTDNTIQLCKQFRKVKVFNFPWENDFSKPRNFGISKCSMDWVLSIDGDEILDKASASAIRKAVASAKSNVHGFGIRICDREESLAAEPNPTPFFPSPQVRLFRRMPSISFSGVVMESVRDSIKASGGGIDLINARIDHWLWRGRGRGYAELRVKYYNRLGAKLPMPTDAKPASKAPILPPPAEPSKVAVVVVTMNALSATKACLQSVSANTTGAYDVICVDNGSTDGTQHVLQEMTGRKPICLGKNEGVARARNAGAAAAMKDPSVEYVCFLDNDTRVSPSWLSDMIAVMDDNPNVGIVGPISCCATGAQSVADQFNKRNYEDVHHLAVARSPKVLPATKVNGFCMVVRVDLLKKIGLFDESFGTYGYEAEDLCRRAWDAGFELRIANQVYVQHRGRATLDSNKGDWQAALANAAIAYATKWNDEIPSCAHSSIGSSSGLAASESLPMPAFRISVVIRATEPAALKECLNSVLSRTPNCEVIVVYDGSPALTSVISTRPTVRPIVGGWNDGIRQSSTRHVVLATDDLVVSTGWSLELADKIGGLDVCGTDGWSQDLSQPGDLPSARCLMARRSAFEAAGLLDESCEAMAGVEFSARARAAGLSVSAYSSTKIKRKGNRPPSGMDRAKERMAGAPFSPEALAPLPKKFRVLYLAPTFDHGVPERGLSYEHDNFMPALEDWDKTSELSHFDFVEMSQRLGVPAMSAHLLEHAKAFCPDIVLAVMQDENHDPTKAAMRKISSSLRAKTFGWFGDSGLRYSNYDKRWAPYLDFCVTTSPEALEMYYSHGFCGKAIKSLWAPSPRCKCVPLRRSIDVCCLNVMHYDRRETVEFLRSSGISVHAPAGDRRMPMEDQVGLINQSKIVINLPSSADWIAREARSKNLDVPACGGMLLTGVDPSGYLEPGREAETFSSREELLEKAKRLLADDAGREAIAAAGLRRVSAHNWATRLDQIVGEAGLA